MGIRNYNFKVPPLPVADFNTWRIMTKVSQRFISVDLAVINHLTWLLHEWWDLLLLAEDPSFPINWLPLTTLVVFCTS